MASWSADNGARFEEKSAQEPNLGRSLSASRSDFAFGPISDIRSWRKKRPRPSRSLIFAPEGHDVAIKLPQLRVVAVDQLLGATFRNLVIKAYRVNTLHNVPIFFKKVGAVSITTAPGRATATIRLRASLFQLAGPSVGLAHGLHRVEATKLPHTIALPRQQGVLQET